LAGAASPLGVPLHLDLGVLDQRRRELLLRADLKAPRRGVLQSVADLEQSIARYIREHNITSKPFVWTKPADSILTKLSRFA